jgi:DNA polymerase V
MLFAIADCNNFYASCERVFQPKYIGRPVIVLSNNDGCVVARSNEAKALGIAMGVPYWQIKDLIGKHQIAVFSSNYQLYGDMSSRVMRILAEHCYELEIYSIDEAFMKFQLHAQKENEIINNARNIREIVERNTGIPISIGLAPSKTLAKLANYISKKITKNGVHCIADPFKEEELLKKIDVGEVWGIGSAYKKKLHHYGIENVWQLIHTNEKWFHKQFTIQGLRLLKELKGEPCIAFEPEATQRKNMVVSRAFRRDVYEINELKEAVANFAERMGEKLRRFGQLTSGLSVFLLANPYKKENFQGPRFCTQYITLPVATANSSELISAAWKALEKCYVKGPNFKKAGIMAYGLQPEDSLQISLFENEEQHFRLNKLMEAVDNINKRFGKGTIGSAACSVTKGNNWQRLEQHRSPRYTTSWDELLTVKSR